MTVHPAEVDTGRVFCVGTTTFPARADYALHTTRCTTLGSADVQVSTVEHLLAALHGLGIDNARIEVEGPEIPILDGSALPFVAAILSAGICGQGKPPRLCRLSQPIELRDSNSCLLAFPADATELALEVTTEFDDWAEGMASVRLSVGEARPGEFCVLASPARTFAFQREVEMLLRAGLAKGASLENALVITPPDTFSSPLRMAQEWCWHKALDVIGDLALVNARCAFQLSAFRPGHRINVLLARQLLF